MKPFAGSLSDISTRILNDTPANQSAFCLSLSSKQALQWRLMLIDLAQDSIDLQYFIWHNDLSGRLLFYRLLMAADRGVKIRLLVDDLPLSPDTDRGVAFAAHHRNISIKIFNPTRSRVGWRRLVEYITRAGELNHRMHNKLLIADEYAAIVGGRNIGDEYFGLSGNMNFVDLDGIALGPAAKLAKNSFKAYWESEWAVDVKLLLELEQRHVHEMIGDIRSSLDAEKQKLEHFSVAPIGWQEQLETMRRRVVPGRAKAIQDDPSELSIKNMSVAGKAINQIAQHAQNELLITSPYFIPDHKMLENFRILLKRGVKIKILTNSIMTINHISAHSGYIKFRKRVLSLGIELHELHHQAQLRQFYDTPPVHSDILGLHAKMVVIDRKEVFVGSLNFDPRAIYLNSENGFIIDSPQLADQAAALFEQFIRPENSWRLTLQKDRVHWSSELGEFNREPMRDLKQKVQLMLLYSLPIEKQL